MSNIEDYQIINDSDKATEEIAPILENNEKKHKKIDHEYIKKLPLLSKLLSKDKDDEERKNENELIPVEKYNEYTQKKKKPDKIIKPINDFTLLKEMCDTNIFSAIPENEEEPNVVKKPFECKKSMIPKRFDSISVSLLSQGKKINESSLLYISSYLKGSQRNMHRSFKKNRNLDKEDDYFYNVYDKSRIELKRNSSKQHFKEKINKISGREMDKNNLNTLVGPVVINEDILPYYFIPSRTNHFLVGRARNQIIEELEYQKKKIMIPEKKNDLNSSQLFEMSLNESGIRVKKRYGKKSDKRKKKKRTLDQLDKEIEKLLNKKIEERLKVKEESEKEEESEEDDENNFKLNLDKEEKEDNGKLINLITNNNPNSSRRDSERKEIKIEQNFIDEAENENKYEIAKTEEDKNKTSNK